jgi:hypothetical protein
MDPVDALRHRLAALRRPAYTGANRCWPCTAVNAAVVVALAAVLSVSSRVLTALVLAGGAALVALRGYVVPGTPRFAPKLVGPLPVEFGHAGGDGVASGTLGPSGDPETVVETLLERGVLRAEGDDLFLDDSFRRAWTERMAHLRAAPDGELATRAADAAGGDVDARFHGERLLLAGGRDVWLSRAVAIAETAAVETLVEWDIPDEVRAPAARPLRTFLGTCPACGGKVRETTLQNCCGGPGSVFDNPERAALACADCGATVFVFEDGR